MDQAILSKKPVMYERRIMSYDTIIEAGKPIAVRWDGELTLRIERTINGNVDLINVALLMFVILLQPMNL